MELRVEAADSFRYDYYRIRTAMATSHYHSVPKIFRAAHQYLLGRVFHLNRRASDVKSADCNFSRSFGYY